MGKDMSVLTYFRQSLCRYGYEIVVFPFEYDNGEDPFRPNSEYLEWLDNHYFVWWIGISLGASFSYVLASKSIDIAKPHRLTLINPFCSREVLAKERDFSLANQWDFSPIKWSVSLYRIDFVLSLYDEKIPMYHGLRLYCKSNAEIKELKIVKDNHIIHIKENQEKLVEYLLK
jgi:hypothetical protein